MTYSAAAIVWVAVYFILPTWMHGATRFVAGYDVAALTLLALLWTRGLHGDARLTRARAALDDPGQAVILFVMLGAVIVGLVSAIAILGHGPSAQTVGQRWLAYGLATIAVSAGWFLVHTVFTFRYAHLYWYDDDGDGTESGGIRFPGTAEPSDFDFAYFAFTLGTSFAVSDPQVTETRVRREVIVHSIIAFAYNSVIIGMVINIFAGIFSSGSGGGGK